MRQENLTSSFQLPISYGFKFWGIFLYNIDNMKKRLISLALAYSLYN